MRHTMIIVLFTSILMLSGCEGRISSQPTASVTKPFPIYSVIPKEEPKVLGTMKYQIEHFPNPDVIFIHVNKELTSETIADCNSGWQVIRLCEQLNPISGIVDVFIHRYKVHIEKAQLFEWEEITKNVLAVLEKYKLDKNEEKRKKDESSELRDKF